MLRCISQPVSHGGRKWTIMLSVCLTVWSVSLSGLFPLHHQLLSKGGNEQLRLNPSPSPPACLCGCCDITFFMCIYEQLCCDECPTSTSVNISHLFFLFSLPCSPSLMMSLISNQGKRKQMCVRLINITFAECFLQKIKSASECFPSL